MYTWLRLAQNPACAGLPERNYCLIVSGWVGGWVGGLLIVHICAFPSSIEKVARTSSWQRVDRILKNGSLGSWVSTAGKHWIRFQMALGFVLVVSNVRTEIRYECSRWDTLWMFALRHVTNVRTETHYEQAESTIPHIISAKQTSIYQCIVEVTLLDLLFT
jgi:hypothetical protein